MDHGGCSLLVGVKGNEIVQVKGDPEGYLNKGYTCFKGRVSPDRLTHPDRLRHPLKRVGNGAKGDGSAFPGSRPWTKRRQTSCESRKNMARALSGSGSECRKGWNISC